MVLGDFMPFGYSDRSVAMVIMRNVVQSSHGLVQGIAPVQ